METLRGKPENPEKNYRRKARTNNKLKPQEAASTGIEPGSQRWEASAYPCFPILFHLGKEIYGSHMFQPTYEFVIDITQK